MTANDISPAQAARGLASPPPWVRVLLGIVLAGAGVIVLVDLMAHGAAWLPSSADGGKPERL